LESVGKSISLRGKAITGTDFDLARQRGNAIVVQYWATWCDPCKKDMETLARLLEKYGPRGFAVVGVNLDADREGAVEHVRRHRLPWVQLHESGGLSSRYALEMGVFSLPTMLLLDSQKRVVNRNIHISQVEDELKKRLR
jgi:thiol-disulfide isomerase/thioredoxin